MLKRGFTLIELLIVVAIIAILAAIAVPNFLEAQVRSKVSRCAADMRSIRVAIESYRVDDNKYPETDTGASALNSSGVGMIRLTTPVAYMTSIPKSPFQEDKIGKPGGAGTANANKNQIYLYVRQEVHTGGPDSNPADGYDDNFQRDRARYLLGLDVGTLGPAQLGIIRTGFWELKSVGPNNVDDFSDNSVTSGWVGTNARVYDPTNGTVSAGDLIQFQDTQGNAQQRPL